MAKQAEVKATVARNVKGHQTLERQRLTTPPKIVHRMAETLDEIRWKSKPAWKSNLEDAPAELFKDQYLRRYKSKKANWIRWEDQKEQIDPKDQQINAFEKKVDLLMKVLGRWQDHEKGNEKEPQKKITKDNLGKPSGSFGGEMPGNCYCRECSVWKF
uniref:Uncharacterized protein n=1 Tax=Romanomermis culicivorax TaxID=13658 RepID=A0A915IRK5_ROMCU